MHKDPTVPWQTGFLQHFSIRHLANKNLCWCVRLYYCFTTSDTFFGSWVLIDHWLLFTGDVRAVVLWVILNSLVLSYSRKPLISSFMSLQYFLLWLKVMPVYNNPSADWKGLSHFQHTCDTTLEQRILVMLCQIYNTPFHSRNSMKKKSQLSLNKS